jgi:LacI family purine nucleotide synthesis repressor
VATIKEVARLAEVSSTTVSIVLNGKAAERKIPPVTCKKIEQAMKALNFRPNLSARRLRSTESQRPIIAFYWPIDYRINMLAWFLNGIQNELKRKSFECEFLVQTYSNDQISKDANAIIKGNYNAVIVGAASALDIAYLESLTLQVPLLLINRTSAKYSTVGVDNEGTARLLAELYKNKGYKEIAIVRSVHKYFATNLRTQKFIEICKSMEINIPDANILQAENTQEGGVDAANRMFSEFSVMPKAIFCDSDIIALGVVYAFNRHGIKIPDDLELLTVAMTETSNTAYYTPSITSVSMPTDKIASGAVNIIIESLTNSKPRIQHDFFEPIVNVCESFKI